MAVLSPRAENASSARNDSRGGWQAILTRTANGVSDHNLSALAAATAFYALLSLFPALTAAVSLYGLVAEPSVVQRQVAAAEGLLPTEAISLIATWLETLTQRPPAQFGVGLIISLLVAFWSAWSATGMLMTAINACYGEAEKRRFVRFNLDAMVLTGGLVLFGFAALVLLALLPAALLIIPVPDGWRNVMGLVRWPILAGIVLLALAVVYHYGPDRVRLRWQWISWGSVAATALWLVGSVVFTIYVSVIGSYDRTYGSLGAGIILLLWFYWTAFVILLGAQLNAECERQVMPVLPK